MHADGYFRSLGRGMARLGITLVLFGALGLVFAAGNGRIGESILALVPIILGAAAIFFGDRIDRDKNPRIPT